VLFERGQVPPLAESEEDRKEVSDAYLEIEAQRHRQLDARVYQSLVKMQRTRDTKIALEGTTEKERLRMIAWEVKTRTQPVIFLPGDSTIEIDIFAMHDGSSVRIVDGDSKEIAVEDAIVTNSTVAILDSLTQRVLTQEEKQFLMEELIALLVGKSYTPATLEALLDDVQADLLSLLIREKRLMALKGKDNLIEFLSYADYLEQQKNKKSYSQSMVLFPRKNALEGE